MGCMYMCVCMVDARSAVESDRRKNRVCDVQYRWEYAGIRRNTATGAQMVIMMDRDRIVVYKQRDTK